ncbi:hypothetical protein CapIbe_020885 [Capra ibex]
MRTGTRGSCDAEFHSGCLLVRVGATAGAVPRPKWSFSLSAAVSSTRLPRSLQSRIWYLHQEGTVCASSPQRKGESHGDFTSLPFQSGFQ